MKTRNIKIDIQTAKDWYYSKYEILKELALKVFSVEELEDGFQAIMTFKDACKVLKLDYGTLNTYIKAAARCSFSKASIAMFKLNIIRKALNLGQDLHLTKGPERSGIYYPCNPISAKNSTFYIKEINLGEIEVIGKIRSEGTEYDVLGGRVLYSGSNGLSKFSPFSGVGDAPSNGFLGCASKEIAQHFGKYFGMLITEAKYGDMVDFEIISSKYPN